MTTTKKKASDKAPKRGSAAWHKAVDRRLEELTESLLGARERVYVVESDLFNMRKDTERNAESRLRDAVVDAALAWSGIMSGDPSPEDVCERLDTAVTALLQHRAKKGGA